jgi:LmbE family N-acetylglucosaminyl deacetylase
MTSHASYVRRTEGGLLRTTRIAELLPDWKGLDERWLFVSPHDDDVVTGAGLTFQVGLAEGVAVHALVVTDGRMGYCRAELRDAIAKVRAEETRNSFRMLGLPAERLWQLDYPDGGLAAYCGRRFVAADAPGAFAGAVGLQNAFTHCLRQVRPNRVFLATSEDLHPDHRIVHEEMLISLFHAQGAIWPELGEPLAAVPAVYEYAVYSDFPEPPQIRVETPDAMLQTKLAAIRAYASQEQIETVVKIHRELGAIEYLREMKFHFYRPQQYDRLFAKER